MPTATILRFGVFELDPAGGELRKGGLRLRLQDQPFQLLRLLLERPGEIVTREEIRAALWPADTFVDFDHSVGTAIAKLRTVLGDSARNPRFIETVASRGYKFIAPVAFSGASQRVAEPTASRAAPDPGRPALAWLVGSVATGIAAAVLVLVIALGFDVLGARDWLRRHTNRPVRALAVLPLENLSGADEDYFVDGLTEQLITSLAQVHGMDVISRTSAMQYKRTTKRMPVVGRELDVDVVVIGSVVRAGDRVRVDAQLVETRTDRHLWAHSYERDVQDILRLQSEVAGAIADEVRQRLAPTSPAAAHAVERRVSPAAQEAYLRGRYHLNQGGEAELRKSVDEFTHAIAIDGSDARSYAGLAEAHVALTDFYERPSVSMPRARTAAEEAVRLDNGLSEAHAALGAVKFLYDWDWAAAERELRLATELAPASADAHSWYGMFLSQMGRQDAAVSEMRVAERLDPLSVGAHVNAGWVFFLARRTDDAVAQWQKATAIEANVPAIHTSLWLGYVQRGEMARFRQEFKQQFANNSPLDLALVAGIYAMSGERDAAERVLHQLEQVSRTRYVCPYEMATACAALGHRDEAFQWLRRAVDEHSVCVPDMKVDPRLDALREDPRFTQLLGEVGFPP